jgi:hypothetical protein
MIPGITQMQQDSTRSFNRRNLFVWLLTIPRQNVSQAIDVLSAEPGFGRAYDLSRKRGGVLAGKLADCEVAFAGPRQIQGSRRELPFVGQVYKRGQGVAGVCLACLDHLGDRKNSRLRRLRLRVHVGHGDIRGAQVDTDDISCHLATLSLAKRERNVPARGLLATLHLATLGLRTPQLRLRWLTSLFVSSE